MRIHWIAALCVAALTLAAGPAAAKSCANSTLSGGYGLLSNGKPASGQPTDTVYRIAADGNGGISGVGIQSNNGSIVSLTVTGSYAVAKNCTGTLSLTDQSSNTANFTFTFDSKQSAFEMMRTDTGFIQGGQGWAIGAATCGLTGARAAYADQIKGSVNATGPVEAEGQIVLDGAGNITGTITASGNGSISGGRIKGSYTINSDCTGTAQFKKSGTTLNFATVTTGSGGRIIMIETDAGALVDGTAQK